MRGEVITREEMLAIPAYEISDLGQVAPGPLVSVIVIAYNHEAYIEQTIEGILAQQCEFPIELIIGEDKSQDCTLEICLDYQKRYPHLIRIVTWHENVGSNANFFRVWGRARGKYVAICEGDDYWIDPAKLTKQVTLMEQSPGTTLCGAWVRILRNSPDSHDMMFGPDKMKEYYTLEDVIETYPFHTSTFFIRTSQFKMPACARSILCLDRIIITAAANQGNLKCLTDTVSVFRKHPGGIYTALYNARKHDTGLLFAQVGAFQAISTFVDERYLPIVRKNVDDLNGCLCHALAYAGQLSQARRLARKTVWRLALQSPERALALLLHICLPKIYPVVINAWTRHKK